MNLISLIIKKMNLINDDIIFVIDKFLTHKETLNLTSSNRYLRFANKLRLSTIIRALVQKQYQEGIRDGFTLLLENMNPNVLPTNNIRGFFMDDPLQNTDEWYNSAQKMNIIINKIMTISSRYNK